MAGVDQEMIYSEQANGYDDAALEIEWQGPSLVFGLMSGFIRPCQTILDIGIGTGLGSEPFFRAGLPVAGIDVSEEMLDTCRKKGCAACLLLHDLTVVPYPFGNGTFDYAISTGVFHFFPDHKDPVCSTACQSRRINQRPFWRGSQFCPC